MTTNNHLTSIAEKAVFQKTAPGLGSFALHPIHLESDIHHIHQWVNQEYAVYWGMNGFSTAEVKTAYQNILNHSEVYIGYFNSEIAFLLECYNPAEDAISNHYEVANGDKGMHILVAPPKNRIPNFTWNIFTVIMDFIFSQKEVERIVVEPDLRNEKIHLLNKKAGFEYQKIIELPHKKAHLAFCTRDQYTNALQNL